MPSTIPPHIQGLLIYLSQPEEKANEDLAIQYFRKVYGESFTRQKEARRADGYVPGSFVLELKGKSQDWLVGLFQGLAYRNEGLDFSQVVVAAKNFLVLWQANDIDQDIREELVRAKGAPNRIGAEFAKKYKSRSNKLLGCATWRGDELSGSLFLAQPDLLLEKVRSFEKALKQGRKVRQRVTTRNFTSVLKEMKGFFDPAQPVKTVRAFYSMVYAWNESSILRLSSRNNDQATLEGELITHLIPSTRARFKEYVENHYISLREGENVDDFFARYDEALDAVDKQFRVKHGIFFTDRDLSKFVMWLVKQHVPNLGKNYLVIDPACGSGNLVTNWRSPLELRHKVVSEIEPELLFAVEKRMRGDQWHNGKFTVVPKVSEDKGLNFLDCSADEYLEVLRGYLAEKGQKPNKPIAFLCNPPYRSDDDQTASEVNYEVHWSVRDITGNDASSERYCCFLAQMKLICDAAKANGIPEDSLLLVFTKSAWLTRRAIFSLVRSNILQSFENVTGILVDGSQFFDIKGKWPVAFSVWRYNSSKAQLTAERSIPLIDLTHVKKEQLANIPWTDPEQMEVACQEIISGAVEVEIGKVRNSIKSWAGLIARDFKRDKRKAEKNQVIVGGLPLSDPRHANKKAYGDTDGQFIGFMDDLTPCRIRHSVADRPWLRLNNQFMDLKKNRCFSGPPTHFGYCASDLDSAKRLFFWYALTRSLLQFSYPMWVDADDLWEPTIPRGVERELYQMAFALAYAENECVETYFPAHNPIEGLPELFINNPLTPLSAFSFWSTTMRPYCQGASANVANLICRVDDVFAEWQGRFNNTSELPLANKPYMLDSRGVTVGSGLVQIKAYATDSGDTTLLTLVSEIQQSLKVVRGEFFSRVNATDGINYFDVQKKTAAAAVAVKQATVETAS